MLLTQRLKRGEHFSNIDNIIAAFILEKGENLSTTERYHMLTKVRRRMYDVTLSGKLPEKFLWGLLRPINKREDSRKKVFCGYDTV